MGWGQSTWTSFWVSFIWTLLPLSHNTMAGAPLSIEIAAAFFCHIPSECSLPVVPTSYLYTKCLDRVHATQVSTDQSDFLPLAYVMSCRARQLSKGPFLIDG